MKIYSVYDAEFKDYGQVITGYDTEELKKTLDAVTPLPEGVDYVPEQPELQNLPITAEIRDRFYGGMPVQMGWCNGHNTKLNCLEYHRDSEVNFGTEDFILLLGKQGEIEADGLFDTKNTKAFLVPAGVLVEVFATSLHYAPCSAKKGQGFKVLVALGLLLLGGTSQGHQYRKASLHPEKPGGYPDDRPEQMAPGPCGFLGGKGRCGCGTEGH